MGMPVPAGIISTVAGNRRAEEQVAMGSVHPICVYHEMVAHNFRFDRRRIGFQGEMPKLGNAFARDAIGLGDISWQLVDKSIWPSQKDCV
jgi:hypothetical protein